MGWYKFLAILKIITYFFKNFLLFVPLAFYSNKLSGVKILINDLKDRADEFWNEAYTNCLKRLIKNGPSNDLKKVANQFDIDFSTDIGLSYSCYPTTINVLTKQGTIKFTKLYRIKSKGEDVRYTVSDIDSKFFGITLTFNQLFNLNAYFIIPNSIFSNLV